MKKITKSEVNNKFILYLKEDDSNCLFLEKYIVRSSDSLCFGIECIVDDPSKSLWDLYSFAKCYLNNGEKYSLCFPYEYDSAFIEGAECPSKIEYYSLDAFVKEEKNKIIKNDKIYKRLKGEKKQIYLDQQILFFTNKLILREKKEKEKYSINLKRYIKCQFLNESFISLKNDKFIKMYSHDNIGWTKFTYSITEDIMVMLNTNFAFGSSRYFYLAIKYKDFVLIPYSDLVHYYYANMKNLISYTRSYCCNRDSWSFALKYVADFVNLSRQDPVKFIREYVIAEVSQMIKGLREIMKDPSEVLNDIKDNSVEYISMKVIRPFLDEDQRIYEIMRSESISVFKAEKITGAMLFVENMNQIMYLCPEIDVVIAEIKEMNIAIKQEVESTLYSIDKNLQPLKEELKQRVNGLRKLDKRIEFYTQKISYLLKNKSLFEYEKIKEDYKRKHPQYVELLDLRNKMEIEISDINKHIERRERLKNRMEICLDRINN